METWFQIPREVKKMRDGMVLASLLAATREYLRLMRHKKAYSVETSEHRNRSFSSQGSSPNVPPWFYDYVGHVVTVYKGD